MLLNNRKVESINLLLIKPEKTFRIGISSTESERKHFMENLNQAQQMPSNISQIAARNRQILQKYQLFGKQLYTIIAVNPDPKWKEDVLQNVNTFRNEIKAYIIKAIDIFSVSILEKDLDGRPKIIINDNIKGIDSLIFEMAEPDFSQATRSNVLECIERLGKPGSKPMFFSAEDLPALDKLIEESNAAVINTYENFARACMNLSKTVRGYSEQNKLIYSEYRRQCGVNPNDVEVRVTVERTTSEA